MKLATGLLAVVAVLSTQVDHFVGAPRSAPAAAVHAVSVPVPANALTPDELTAVVQHYCVVCHNDRLLTGNMSLQDLDVANPLAKAQLAEKMIQKLRAGMMPPPGAPRPGPDTLAALVETLEHEIVRAAAAHLNP